MSSLSVNWALYSIQVIHTQKDSQLMNSASAVKKKALNFKNLQAFLCLKTKNNV